MFNYLEHFSRDPKVCNGHTVIKGTRVPLQVIMDNLAEGLTIEEIVAEYPVTPDDVKAAIAFAAAETREDEPLPLANTA